MADALQREQRPVRVVTDSGADLPFQIAQELDITAIPLLVHIGGRTYREGVDISGELFYRELEAAHSVTTTSLPALESFAQAYRQLTAQGFDVVSVHLSSKLSGTFNAALMASTADGVAPEAIAVVDTRTISMAQGWIAIRAAEAAHAGKSLSEVASLAESLVPHARLYGVLDSLEYVARSGRVARMPARIGDALNVKPIITILPTGEASLLERVRTRKRALERIVELTADLGPLDALAVMHGADEEGAAQLAEMLKPLKPPQPVVIGHIGAVLGTHIGPRAVGVCCLTRTGQ